MAHEITRRDAVVGLAAAGAACAEKPRAVQEGAMSTTVDPVTAVHALGFAWPTPDPFLFCVHHDDHYPKGNERFGPAASLAGRTIGQDFEGKDGWRMYHGSVVPGFPQHPHRGFETVTVVRRGLLDHSDSMGAAARYGQGDVQWLTAGAGIQHAEMFPLLEQSKENPVELFQIWLNLPRADKLATPHFSMLWGPQIPTHSLKDDAGRAVEVTTVAGTLLGKAPPKPPPSSWASRPDSDVAIWTVKLSPRAQWTLPAAKPGTNRWLYFFKGDALRVGSRALDPSHAAELKPDVAVTLTGGAQEVEALVLQGRPIAEPVVQYGPFVMNSREEIQQTFLDYQRTQFGGWPWKSDDPVHGRDEGRFARRPDGTVERPA